MRDKEGRAKGLKRIVTAGASFVPHFIPPPYGYASFYPLPATPTGLWVTLSLFLPSLPSSFSFHNPFPCHLDRHAIPSEENYERRMSRDDKDRDAYTPGPFLIAREGRRLSVGH